MSYRISKAQFGTVVAFNKSTICEALGHSGQNKGQGHFSSPLNPSGMSSLPVCFVCKIRCQGFWRADLQAAESRGRLHALPLPAEMQGGFEMPESSFLSDCLVCSDASSILSVGLTPLPNHLGRYPASSSQPIHQSAAHIRFLRLRK